MKNQTQNLKKLIINNVFVDQVRSKMHIDEFAYKKLCEALQDLSIAWKDETLIDKELAFFLYSIPLMVRNAFLSFSNHDSPPPKIALRLEDIWIELDELVAECFSD